MISIVGSIPDKIKYIYPDSNVDVSVNTGSRWDIYDEIDSDKNIKVKVTKVSVVDASDQTSITREITYAANGGYNFKTKSNVVRTYSIEEVDNTPIKNIKLLTQNSVLINDKYFVNIDDGVLVETILKVGINAGGVLNGEFVWVKQKNHLMLARVGSNLHETIKNYQDKSKESIVPKKNFDVGGIYKDAKGNKAVFLGFVCTTKYGEIRSTPIKYGSVDPNHKNFNYTKKKVKKAFCFYKLSKYYSFDQNIEEMLELDKTYNFAITVTHKFIEKTDSVELPENIIQLLRNRAAKKLKEYVAQFASSNTSGYKPSLDSLYYEISSKSDFVNLYKFNDKEREEFDVKKYLLFC
jgi:hypothetical protein